MSDAATDEHVGEVAVPEGGRRVTRVGEGGQHSDGLAGVDSAVLTHQVGAVQHDATTVESRSR